ADDELQGNPPIGLWRGRTPRQSLKCVREVTHARAYGGESPSTIMKRPTDVSQLRSADTQEPVRTGVQHSGCDAAVERAATLLIHGMQQSHNPIEELGGALARIAQTLNDIGGPLFGAAAAQPTADLHLVRDALARDIAVCIQSLQFHDRLMQQLTQ